MLLKGATTDMFAAYFEPKRWENQGRPYERLGVKPFKRALLYCVTRIKPRHKAATGPNNYFLWDPSPEGMARFERYTRRNEAVHLLVTVFILYGLYMYIRDGVYFKLPYYATLLVLNTYAIFLQRYNRIRIQTALERGRRRTA